MDFQSMMETFAEAWVAANTQTPLTEAAAAAADHQQLLLGLSGSSTLPGSLDITSNEAMSRRLVSSGTSTSTTQSPGLNLSSHPPTEDGSLSPSYAASSILELKEAISGNNARNTIPIHCVIERSNPALLSPGTSGPSTGSQPPTSQCSTTSPPLIPSTSSATDLSMAMVGSSSTVVGSTSSSSGSGSSNPNSPTVIEQDTYAILSASIPLNDIVRSVLTKLGYAPQEMVGAKAFVQLRNWKPLTLDQISESVEATIGDIFSDIASFITLRIRLFRPRMSAAHELKDKLLQVLLAHSYSLLANSGAPIDQQILSSLIRGGRNEPQQDPNDDARRRFDQWYLQQVFNQYRQFALAAQQPTMAVPGLRPNSASSAAGSAPGAHPLFLDLNMANGNDPTLAAAAAAGIHPSFAAAAAAASVRPTTNGNMVPNNTPHGSEKMYGHKQSNSSNHNSSSGHHPSITSSRTRIRTSFDPELELPKLHKWFAENRHPSRSQVQEYVKELNSLESRKGRKPLDVNNVVYWFKNARAAHKRAELKFISNDSNTSAHAFGPFGQGSALSNDFFINGGNHSPGKASSDASISGKCNDEPLSNASRNGSNMDDYYSFDEDGDSHEETQTLDLSVRNNMHHKMFSISPVIDIKNEQDDSDELKIMNHDIKCEVQLTTDIDTPLDFKTDFKTCNEPMDISGRIPDYGASSDCNSIDDDSEEESDLSAGINMSNMSIARNLSNLIGVPNNMSLNPHNPESPEGRRTRRSRTFIDPMSEVPRLENWFISNTHPAHSQIVRYTEELNKMPYRQKFPKLEPKNIQFWFKNRRAKIKRTSGLSPSGMSLSATSSSTSPAQIPVSLGLPVSLPVSLPSATSNSTMPSQSMVHNSSALNIERLINAH